MVTDHGLAYVLQRLSDAPDLPALKRVWDGIATAYQRHPEVQAHKDRLKQELSK